MQGVAETEWQDFADIEIIVYFALTGSDNSGIKTRFLGAIE